MMSFDRAVLSQQHIGRTLGIATSCPPRSLRKLLDTTPALDRFESIVDDMKKRGQTAIYSSILEARALL